MSSRRKGLAIVAGFVLLIAGSFALGSIAAWLAFVPFTAFAIGLSVLALLSARTAGRTSMDLSPLPLYRLTMVLTALLGVAFAAFFGATGALSRFAPHAPSGSRTHALALQTGTFYVTPGLAATFHALEVAVIVAFAAAFLVGVLWHCRNGGAWQRPQRP